MVKKSGIYLGWAQTPVSAEVLTVLQDSLDIRYSRHCRFGESLDQAALAQRRVDLLCSFGPVLVSQALLDSVGIAAINFHTGPPRWPGRGSCSFALLAGDTDFGVTAHVMTAQPDSGPIMRVHRFPIAPDETAETLHAKTLHAIPELVRAVMEDLVRSEWHVRASGETWERRALRQRDLMDAMRIEDDDSETMVQRKIRAFAHSKKPGPYMVRHGYRFWYVHQADSMEPIEPVTTASG